MLHPYVPRPAGGRNLDEWRQERLGARLMIRWNGNPLDIPVDMLGSDRSGDR
jgi:hypothetical protein